MADTKAPARRIPVCEPLFLGKEAEYAQEAMRSGWISSSGKYLKSFEEKFSAYCGVRHGVTTTSGTTALHLALRALDIKAGDEVIIPDFTMVAVLFSVLYCSAKPVFVDADPDTWNMDASKIEAKITKKTRAIIAVHTYGHPCDMTAICAIAKKHGLRVIEDAAEAHGAKFQGKTCGSFGDISAFSFYANKIITTGEGGMVVTQDDELAERCRYFKNLCFPLSGPRNYQHEDLGYNYRMTNVQAAIGLAQLENIEEFVDRRRKNAKAYNDRLSKIPGVQCPVERPDAKNVYWMYGIVLDPKIIKRTRDEFCHKLSLRGIETRLFFHPMHQQGVLGNRLSAESGQYTVSIHLGRQGFYLPSGSGLSQSDLDAVCDAVKDVALGG